MVACFVFLLLEHTRSVFSFPHVLVKAGGVGHRIFAKYLLDNPTNLDLHDLRPASLVQVVLQSNEKLM
jgi:hypothetical protein